MCVKVRYVHCGRKNGLVAIVVVAGGVGRHGCKSLCLLGPVGDGGIAKVVRVAVVDCYAAAFCADDCFDDSNLVDSASSHTLVSKIKPCMCKYKSCTLKLRTAHYISDSPFDNLLLLG